jgi:hypothetical protein
MEERREYECYSPTLLLLNEQCAPENKGIVKDSYGSPVNSMERYSGV